MIRADSRAGPLVPRRALRGRNLGGIAMFGLLGERLRRLLSDTSMAAGGGPTAATKGLPERLKVNGSTDVSNNGQGNPGPASETVVSSDSVLPAAGQAKVNESLQEAPGVAQARGGPQIAD
jgi:hypothetical protein